MASVKPNALSWLAVSVLVLVLDQWSKAWVLSWLMMIPVVLLIAPWLRRLVNYLTDSDNL